MITNAKITIFHKELDPETRLEKWTKHNYHEVWMFKKQGIVQNNGFENSNSAEIRIPYNLNPNLNIENFSKTDVVVEGIIEKEITTIQELSEYETYLITFITNNVFGTKPHIHLKAN